MAISGPSHATSLTATVIDSVVAVGTGNENVAVGCGRRRQTLIGNRHRVSRVLADPHSGRIHEANKAWVPGGALRPAEGEDCTNLATRLLWLQICISAMGK
jgi:hypothetical protein